MPQPTETVAAIQIQGNTATTDDEVRRLADVRVGMPFDATTVESVAARLRAAKRFERVEVRKRFASIADPSQITLVIVVDEGPVKIVMTGDPDSPTRVVRKRLPNMLVLPILGREDGYGLTYGARLTLPDPQWMGKRSRVMFPLTWGGTKQAAIDLEKRFDGGVIDRVTAGASISRRQNLAFDQDDDRARLFVRGEHEFARQLQGRRDDRVAARVLRGRRRLLRTDERRRGPGHARRSGSGAQRRLRQGVVGTSRLR